MLQTIRQVVLLILVLFSPGLSRAQIHGQFIEASQPVEVPFTVTNFGTQHGLPQNQVSSIIAKKNGELIISTANGIVAFDGTSFYPCIPDKSYLRLDHRHLFYDNKSNRIYSYQSADRTISQIYPQIKQLFKTATVNSTKNGMIGCTMNGMIWEFDYASKKKKNLFKTSVYDCRSILKDGYSVYLSDWKHLYLFDLRTKKLRIISDDTFTILKKNPFNGRIYGITAQQLLQLSPKGCNEVSLSKPDPATKFSDLEFSPEGEFFVTSTTGLFYHHPAYNEHYGKSSFLPTNYLVSLHYDSQENCLFVGSSNKGLFKLVMKNCQSMTDFSDLSGIALNSVTKGNDHGFYISTTENTIYKFSINSTEKVLDLDPLNVASCSVIDGNLFVGTWGKGVLLYRGNKYIGNISPPNLPGNQVFASFRDSRGFYWIGTNAGIAVGKTPASVRPLRTTDVTGRIICFYERQNGDICVGGSNGLFILDKLHRLKAHYRSDKEIICKEIRSFLEDKEGKLWIATYNGGLYCLDHGKMTSVNNLPNCHLSAEIFTLAKNNNGDIFMSSNIGLWMVNERKLNDFYHRRINYLIPFYYGNESGILNSEFNGGFQNNYLHTSYDHFYFPSIEGLVIVYPETLKFRKIRPTIRSVIVDGKSASGRHYFSRETRSIEFKYYVPNFLSKFNIHYQFRLSGPGIRPEWGKMQKEGYTRFEYLPPGNYELTVRAVDGFNDGKPEKTVYRFTIAPYWYETWWALGSGTLLLIVLLLWLAWYRSKKLRDKEQRESSINNTLLELKLKAINAKMNPHFIFNALNNIQYLIILDKNDEAEQALNRFSQLLRKFLHQSEHSFVRLSEELSLLELYIDIEQYRFEGKLEVHIDVQGNCGNLVIPTLLLQPVIENAIKHGLVHSDGIKILKITARKSGENLEIMIEDNGIGRNKAETINLNRKEYVSHGWRLVDEKIRMVRDKYGIKIGFEITDKPNTDSGTIVVFTISPIDEALLGS